MKVLLSSFSTVLLAFTGHCFVDVGHSNLDYIKSLICFSMDLFSYRTWILFEVFISQQLLFLLLIIGLLFIGWFVFLYLWFLILYQRCSWKRFSPILWISSSINLQYVYLYSSFIVLCDFQVLIFGFYSSANRVHFKSP